MKTRISGSHQRYLDAGCVVSRTVLGPPLSIGTQYAHMTEIHYYGKCRLCGNEMRDVDERGYEDVSASPYTATYYGDPDTTICTSCAGEVYRESVDLTGRMAKCAYSTTRSGNLHNPETVKSGFGLAFFEYKPDKDFDTYYCGCHGWD